MKQEFNPRHALKVAAYVSTHTPVIKAYSLGYHGLPDTTVRGLAALVTMQQRLLLAGVGDPAEARNAWTRAVVAATISGAEPPTVDDLNAALDQAERDERERTALQEACSLIATSMRVELQQHADRIYDDHVHPSFAALFDEVEQVRDGLDGLREAEAVLRGSDAQRAAWVRLPDLAARYAVLRESAMCLDRDGAGMSRYLSASDFPVLPTDAALVDVPRPGTLKASPITGE